MNTALPFGLKRYTVTLKVQPSYSLAVTAKSPAQAIAKATKRTQQEGASRLYPDDWRCEEA